jgi:hypothetical protein
MNTLDLSDIDFETCARIMGITNPNSRKMQRLQGQKPYFSIRVNRRFHRRRINLWITLDRSTLRVQSTTLRRRRRRYDSGISSDTLVQYPPEALPTEITEAFLRDANPDQFPFYDDALSIMYNKLIARIWAELAVEHSDLYGSGYEGYEYAE